MKPNFALSLSFEGIRLLHRLGSGWSLVGEVPLDAPDLAQQLAVLRKTGLALDPQGLRTKLLIPNDQIKYLALDTTRATDDDVRRALDGTTPYAVDDLVYDYVRGGGRTYIAAVARETLAEAEAFAAEHRFGPVCFAGVPEQFSYVGEAFFGQTTVASRLIGADQMIERDDIAVNFSAKPRAAKRPVDPVSEPDIAASVPDVAQEPADVVADRPDLPAPDPAAADTVAAPLILTAVAAAAGMIEPDPVQSDFVAVALPGDIKVSVPSAQPADPALALADPDPAGPRQPLKAAAGAAQAVDFTAQALALSALEPAENLPLPNPQGQSLNEDVKAEPKLAPEPRLSAEAPLVDLPPVTVPPDATPVADVPLVGMPTRTDPADVPRASLVPEPVFSSRARPLRADASDVPPAARPLPPPPGSRTPGLNGRDALADQRADQRAGPVFSRRTEPPVFNPKMPKPAQPAPAQPAPAQPAPAQAQSLPIQPTLVRPPPPPPPPMPHLAGLNGTAPQMAPPRLTGAARTADDGFSARPVSAALPDPAAAPAITGQSGVARPAAAVAATVIPFRPSAAPDDAATPVSIETITLTRPTPATAALQPADPAPIPPGSSGYFASKHGNPSTHQAQPAVIRNRTPVGGKPRYLALILTLILLACLAAVAAWATFISETGIAGLFGLTSDTEVAADAADPPLSAAEITETALIAPNPEVQATLAPAIDALPNVALLPALPEPDVASETTPDIPAEVAAAEPTADPTAVPTPEPSAGTLVSPAEADRIYAATGVWLRAPRLPLIPTSDHVGTLTLAALDSGAARVTLPAMPPVAGASPDQAILPQLDPPAPGTVFERDAQGFVLATPEGTLTPDGILVFAGLPAILPPTRPGTPVPEVAELTPVALPEGIPELAPEIVPTIAAVAAPPLAPRDTLPAPDPLTDPALLDPTADPAADPALDPATAGGVGLASLQPLVRPLVRPGTLPPADTDAPVLTAFAGPRPLLRPQGLAPLPPETAVASTEPAPETPADPSLAVADTVAAILAAAPPDPPDLMASATALAVASARIPAPRPQNFAEVVASAEARNAPAATVAAPQNASLAVVEPEVQIAPATVAPSGPVPGGVAENATLTQAIDLRAVNLIGVFGRPNDRRALVRLANGRYVRVGVGDSLDGGQVAAIGDNALNYVKRGQTITIAIPNG